MEEDLEIIDKIIDLCFQKGFTAQRTLIIGYHLGSEQAYEKHGSNFVAYRAFYEKLKDIYDPDTALEVAAEIAGIEI